MALVQGPLWSCRCGICGAIWRDVFPTQADAEAFLRRHEWGHVLRGER